MTLIALVISLFVAALGALGLFFPFKLLAFARHFESRVGLWAIGLIRVVFGMALFQSAHTSHAPEVLRILGGIIFTAGLITPWIGVLRTSQILNGLSAQGPIFMQFLAGLALVVGFLLAYAVVT
jgi:hypothetical protein